MDILLHHVVQLVIGAEHPVKDLEHHRHQAQQHRHQYRNGHAVHKAQPYADAHGGNQGQNEHHGAADGHADHHLEGHLQIGHIRGKPRDDGGGGEFVNIPEAEALDMMEHIMPQIPGEARARLGGQHRAEGAEAQRCQGAEHQLHGL